MTDVGRSLRGARAAVFAAVCVSLTAAGHVWMSGDAVPLWAVALAFATLVGAGYALAGRQRGFLPISSLMLAGELGQHLLFSAAQSTAGSASTAASSPASIPAQPTFRSGRVLPLSDWICGMAGSSATGMTTRDGSLSARLATDLMSTGHGGAGMIVVHAAAGLLCAWWLWRGEAAVFQLLRWLAAMATPALPLLSWPATLVVPEFPRSQAPIDDRVLGRVTRLISTLVVRRGPPRTALCALCAL